jgi:LMBR1 domain-containing protein 1
MLIIVVSIILFGSYAGLRFATLPVLAYNCVYTPGGKLLVDPTTPSVVIDTTSCSAATETELNITVSFPIYVIALASWVGWWLLVLFLGAGLSALPVDLINQFRFRPTPMKQDEFARAKSEMAKQVDKLIQIGKTLLEDRIKADKASGCKNKIIK